MADIRKVVRVRGLGACYEWQGAINSTGYGNQYYNGRVWLAHRVAWTKQVGPIPDGMLVCHTCDNRKCVRLSHLFLGTHSDNMRDMVAKGRADNAGERNGRHILSGADIVEIRARYTGTKGGNPSFVSQVQLAQEYGVSQAHISKIVRGRNW